MNLLIQLVGIRAGTIDARTSYHNGAHPAIWRRVEHIWKLTRKSQSSCSDSTFTDYCCLIMNQQHATWRSNTLGYCFENAQAQRDRCYRKKWNWTFVDPSGWSERSQFNKAHGKIGRVSSHTVVPIHHILWTSHLATSPLLVGAKTQSGSIIPPRISGYRQWIAKFEQLIVMIGEDYYNYVTKIRLYSAKRSGGRVVKTFRHPCIENRHEGDGGNERH
jgi:hypothetical protein